MCNAKVIIPSGRTVAVGMATALGLATVANGQVWIQVTSEAPWAARSGHGCLAYDGRIWVFGGSDEGGNLLNDVWYSTDGEEWTEATEHAGWSPRVNCCPVVHDGKMWILGGWGVGGQYLNDVWWSTGGVTWTEATHAAGWSARYNLACESINGKMWMLGGRDAGGYLSDVWSSVDGENWVEEKDPAEFPHAASHGSVVFDDKMCIMGGWTGGGFTDDVYCSANGVDWTLATADPGWTPRGHPNPVAWSNAIWAMGGANDQQPRPWYFKDVWYSPHATAWFESSASPARWEARTHHAVMVFDDKIWVIGGATEGTTPVPVNDVWYFPSPIPAVSEWGLVAMSVLILAGGTVVLVRRRVAVTGR